VLVIKGLSRTEISGLFSRNAPANQIALALGELDRGRLAAKRSIIGPNGGRPSEFWVYGAKR